MLSFTDLRTMARARIDDAEALVAAGRYDGANYIVGYAVEYSLKARIATHVLGNPGWPETSDEFATLKNLQSHNLEKFLKLSGREARVSQRYKPEWPILLNHWAPEKRYQRIGRVSEQDARNMIQSVRRLLRVL
jgi:HEPN domain-containing protein